MDLHDLLRAQAGVVSRRQILAAGGGDSDIARLLRRRELSRVYDGVYVAHTGPLTSGQRAWAAVLLHWPAALCHRSALGHADPTDRRSVDDTVHVAIDQSRKGSRVAGVRVHRVTGLDRLVLTNLSPPRVRIEFAVLQVAADAPTERAAVAVLADACRSRRTTPARLAAQLAALPNLRHRRVLHAILDDVAAGTHSVLERMYLTRVERAHGLPIARRQRRVHSGRGPAYRDVEYVEHALIVELDGRLGHEEALDRWADLDRDIVSAIGENLTLRLGYGQVLDGCRMAGMLARVLTARGWTGAPRSCGPQCSATGGRGRSHASGEGDLPLPAAAGW